MFAQKGIHVILAVLTACALQACNRDTNSYPRKKITFHVIPRFTPDSGAVYITGDNPLLGDWNPRAVALEKQAGGSWKRTFSFPLGLHLKYKFTRGSWLNEAIDVNGLITGNSTLTIKNDTTILIEVPAWKDASERVGHKNLGSKDTLKNDTHKTITFRIVPQFIPDTAPIYIAGNSPLLGYWNPGAVRLDRHVDGSWSKSFAFPPGSQLEYKITRGYWDNEAIYSDGRIPPRNSRLEVERDTTIIIRVISWKDVLKKTRSTAAKTEGVLYKSNEQISRLDLADKYYDKGWALLKERRPDSSIFYLKKAIGHYEKLAQWRRLMVSYSDIGVNLTEKLDYENALKYYHKALDIGWKKFGDFQPALAEIYDNIGQFYKKKGDNDRAIEFYHNALASWQPILDGTISVSIPGYEPEFTYKSLGETYRLKGDSEKALEYYDKFLKKVIDTYGEPHPVVADCYDNIGNIFFDKGAFNKAKEYYNRALAIKLFFFDHDHPSLASSYRNLGNIYLRMRRYSQARDYFDKTLSIWINVRGKKHPEVAASYQSLAEFYYQQKSFDKALTCLQRSLIALVPDFNNNDIRTNPPLTNSFSDDLLLTSLELKAKVVQELSLIRPPTLKYLGASFVAYELAVELIDKIRSGYKAEDSKLFLAEKNKAVYEQAFQTALKLYETTKDRAFQEKAFLFAERGRAGILLQSLQDTEAKTFAGIPPSLLKREKELRIDLAFYDTELQKEKQKNTGRNENKIKEFENRLFVLHREYDAIIENFEQNYPAYFELKYRTQTVSAAALQATLDEQTAVVEYFVGESAIYVIIVSKEDLEIVSLPKDENFTLRVAVHFNAIKRVVDEKKYVENSICLYEALIKPVENKIAGKEKLVVIPDGVLFYVPFEALIANKSGADDRSDFTNLDYLLKRFDISYHYSATLYYKTKNKVPNQLFTETLMAVAPVFNENSDNGFILASNVWAFANLPESEKMELVTRDGSRLQELKHSEVEVQTIVKLFSDAKRKSVGYFHRQATEENFKTAVGKYKYVHISTHGFMNGDIPQLSGLAFSQPHDSTSAEDGILYSREAYNLNLRADLVVLSSCESGMGKLVKGEGLMALTRGFLYSGARNVVVSLWKVFDEHTSQLMIEFYRQMLAGKSYSAALREAKLKMIANPNTAFPASWASFVLIGA